MKNVEEQIKQVKKVDLTSLVVYTHDIYKKQCPNCGGIVTMFATKCRHCGYMFRY